MLEVKIRDKAGTEKSLYFDKSSVMLGRSAGNDIVLTEGGVSRFHAILAVEDNRIFIQDVGSTNGTFVGSERIDKKLVAAHDQILIGDYTLAVKLVEEAPAGSGTIMGAQSLKSTADPQYGKDTAEVTRDTPAESTAAPEASEPEKRESSDDFYWQSLQSFLRPIWDFITDDGISEVMINGPTEIYIERKGKLERVERKFTSEELAAAVLNIAQYVGRRVSEDEPYLDARLPDGSRVAVLLPPCARKGTSIAIRKFSKEKLTLDRLIQFGSLSAEMVAYIKAAVMLKKNIIVSGGTSSGKTSLLNVISGLIPNDERIITIEDAAELQLVQDHVVPMETKPPDKKGRGQVTIRDLVRASLRMRPDRVVVGEIRGGEAIDLLQAMNTGHSGSMATVHASSPPQALTRLETLSLFSGLEIPMRALREQVSTAVEVVVQAARLPDHSRKVTHIAEIHPLAEDGSYITTDIFRFVRTDMQDGKVIGEHRYTGAMSRYFEEMELAGLADALAIFQQGS